MSITFRLSVPPWAKTEVWHFLTDISWRQLRSCEMTLSRLQVQEIPSVRACFTMCWSMVSMTGMDDDVKKMLTFANAAASLITTRKGALRVMPEKGEVEAVIK